MSQAKGPGYEVAILFALREPGAEVAIFVPEVSNPRVRHEVGVPRRPVVAGQDVDPHRVDLQLRAGIFLQYLSLDPTNAISSDISSGREQEDEPGDADVRVE